MRFRRLLAIIAASFIAAAAFAQSSSVPRQANRGRQNLKGQFIFTAEKTSKSAHRKLADLPFGITSFGAALVNGHLYVYGGHMGSAHEYAAEEQNDHFLRLDLGAPKHWEVVGTVPRRAGLAMVSFGGKIYRVGGFEARNKKGEHADLHSVADFSRFDPATGRWEGLTPMPKARSSHEAVVVGNRLIVVGGWDLQGKNHEVWHDTAIQTDLTSANPVWEEIPKPPFHRRAMALGAHHGKLYVLGGMQKEGGPTTTSYVFDSATGKWSPGAKLPGEGLEGFGGCAVECGDRLYVSTYSGKLSYLSEDGQTWREAGQLDRPRFFHRMLCAGDSSLIVLGGANMQTGKDLSVEMIPLGPSATAAR
jgi:N-acetylneuraminic acid mutarotase